MPRYTFVYPAALQRDFDAAWRAAPELLNRTLDRRILHRQDKTSGGTVVFALIGEGAAVALIMVSATAIPVFLPWAPGEFRSGLGHGY